jgi:signal transduction histidine kinase
MSVWQDMLTYVDFCESDQENLRAAWPLIESHQQTIVTHFYDIILGHPDARAVFDDQAQVLRLQNTMKQWMKELLLGPWDEAYFQRRQRIGRVHVRIRLPERYMFTAMNRMRQDMIDVVFDNAEKDQAKEMCRSISKIADLDLAAMTSTYMEAREWQQLRTLQDLIIHNMPVTVLCLDADGQVASATAPGTRLLNPQATVGQPLEAFLPPELLEVANLEAAMERAQRSGRVVTIPRALLIEQGNDRHFRITVVPLAHELAHMLVHLEELTDVVHAEVRAQQAESLARIGTLAANIAHEIRNPLAAISATLQVIGGSLATDDRRKVVLEKVGDQVFRLDRLVSDLLGYSRPAQVSNQVTELRSLARDAVAQSGVEVELRGEQDCQVFADPQYTSQVIVNLLQNARDAGGPVWIELGPGPSLRICDSGPGVSAEVRDRLFEPFVTTKTRGTGLGLAISRKYTEAMGGSLELLDGDGGACFRIGLLRAPHEAP